MFKRQAHERALIGTLCTIFALWSVLFLLPLPASAQLATGASLAVEPTFPTPESIITISIDAYSIDTVGATISWFINGSEITASKNDRSITLNTGTIGKKMSVSATIKPLNGPTFTLRRDIIPASIDLVIETNTYVPAFYKGRALPSGNASIRAIAVPHLGRPVSPSTLTYKWEYGGGVLLGGPVRGKQSIDLTMSRFSDNRITVTVIDESGQSLAQKTMLLNPTDPELHFYEDNPLRGLHERAITKNLTLIGDETTVYGEPYFMNTDLSSESAAFTWSINGIETTYQNPDPHTITLRRSGGSGSAAIELEALSTTQIPQYLQKAFTIVF